MCGICGSFEYARDTAAADPELRARMESFQSALEEMVLQKDAALREKASGPAS